MNISGQNSQNNSQQANFPIDNKNVNPVINKSVNKIDFLDQNLKINENLDHNNNNIITKNEVLKEKEIKH